MLDTIWRDRKRTSLIRQHTKVENILTTVKLISCNIMAKEERADRKLAGEIRKEILLE